MFTEVIEESRDRAEEELEQVASFLHGVLGARMMKLLSIYVEERNLGWVLNSSTTFDLKDGLPRREPDLSFVSREKMPLPLDEEVSFAPDLAVEVISKTDDWSAIVAKANQYLKAGTALVWVIDPYLKGIFVFHQNDPFPQILKPEEELEGEKVLPGFKLKVSALFV